MARMHIIDRGPGRVKLLRFKPPGYDQAVKLSAYIDAGQSRRLGDRIDSLIAAALNGDPPPRELSQWIASMPDRIAARLANLGLLDRRRREAARPIARHHLQMPRLPTDEGHFLPMNSECWPSISRPSNGTPRGSGSSVRTGWHEHRDLPSWQVGR